MTAYHPGDIVTITITRARVANWSPGLDELTINHNADANNEQTTFDLAAEEIAVDLVESANWPPQPGDLWRDRDGRPWFVIENHNGNPVMNGLYGDRHGHEYVQKEHGPLHLVHREEAGQ